MEHLAAFFILITGGAILGVSCRLLAGICAVGVFAIMPPFFEAPLQAIYPTLFEINKAESALFANIIQIIGAGIVSFGLLVATFFFFTDREGRKKLPHTLYLALLCFTFFTVMAGISGDALVQAASHIPLNVMSEVKLSALFVSVVLIIGFIYKMRTTFVKPIASGKKQDKLEGRQILLMALSSLPPFRVEAFDEIRNVASQNEKWREQWSKTVQSNPEKDLEKDHYTYVTALQRWIACQGADQLEKICADQGNFGFDEKALLSYRKIFGNWQQALRVVNHHAKRGRLETLYLLTSQQIKPSNQKGSYEQHEEFLALLKILFPKVQEVVILFEADKEGKKDGYNFEDFDSLDRAFEDFNTHIKNKFASMSREKLEKEVYIDLTGGQKLYSAVAAIHTLNCGFDFSYLSTNLAEDIQSINAKLEIGGALP